MFELGKKLLTIIKDRKLPKNINKNNFKEFASNFFLESNIADFLQYSDDDLYNHVLSAYNFISLKGHERSKIRIFNPNQSDHGFESYYTIIEIANIDAPFLVDSTVGYLDKYSIEIINIIHPTYLINRDISGNITKISCDKKDRNESIIQFHIDKINNDIEIENFTKGLEHVIETVNLVVAQWKNMLEVVKSCKSQIDNAVKIVDDVYQLQEIKDFIDWMVSGNFVLLGVKEFDIKKNDKSQHILEEVKDREFGVFCSQYDEMRPSVINSTIPEIEESVKNPYIIEILKSRYRSKIHRIANAERVRIQKISPSGKVIGEYRIIGLFTSSAYNQSMNLIPIVRKKALKVIMDSGFIRGSHNYKDLVTVLEFYPRDELFQICHKDLLKNAVGIVSICGRSKVKFFARKDKFERFVSCLIFTPKDRSNSELRSKIRNYLAQIYKGEVADFFVQINDTNLVRIHIIIRNNSQIPNVDEIEVEKEITKMTRIWIDDLLQTIRAKYSEEMALDIYSKYKNSFSVSYKNRFNARRAAIDISYIEECINEDKAIFKFYKSSKDLDRDIIELKIYNPHQELPLSKIMPILNSFNLDVIKEHTYPIDINKEGRIREKKVVWINYFNLKLGEKSVKYSYKLRLNFEKAISLIWSKIIECGDLNKLLISADLNWKQIYMLRAYTRYIYQTDLKYKTNYIADTLNKHHNITRNLVELFEVRFNPYLAINIKNRDDQVNIISARIKSQLSKVSDAIEDSVIRSYFLAIMATLRTNYYQSKISGGFKGYISFKFNSKEMPNLPLPRPFAEIFVYSNEVEAIHLRGGKVARGGLRWSDRVQDYRTEILGLMKAQMTKNAVIVPEGSKGGFVVKKDLSNLSRSKSEEVVIECYKTFLRGVLDITDNVINNKISHPKSCIIYDDSDPYLVVAADKGTATFSDTANSISNEYNFWLGDAFASGGSYGYDHKKMGITAKGAWVSVMRHFREIGFDTQSQDFTCVGIGDMMGDVFGNGMLLSKHIRLVAAFNHMHIFIDPNPDSAKSYKERQRLFKLDRSSWMDYDKSLISKGGAIFERKAKSIKITPEIANILDIKDKELSPSKLINAILKAPVDLLWNGGIGTYVKSTAESDLDAGDKANDDLRVNGNELRCKVIGEGGNLGLTQKGRIEYALNGGLANTDAMDNSAGVDCSDHEVNIKIALFDALAKEKISFLKRNKILESMTQNVSDLVLKDNNMQTQAISIANSMGYLALGEQGKFLDRLEKNGELNRDIEFLPSNKEIDRRQNDKIGMTRPELCVMLSYAKIGIYKNILQSNLVKDKYFNKYLFNYFPEIMQSDFIDEITNHQLSKEIISTQLTNLIVDRAGITFVDQLVQETGYDVDKIAKSFIIAIESFELNKIWSSIELLSGKVSHEIIVEMFQSSIKLLERSVKWLLKKQFSAKIENDIKKYKKSANDLWLFLSQVLAKASRQDYEEKAKRLHVNKVPNELSYKIAAMDPIASAFDIWEISQSSKIELKVIAKIYFEVGTRFYLKKLRSRIAKLNLENHWHKISSKAILDDLYNYQMKISKSVVDFMCDNDKSNIDSIESWIKNCQFIVDRYDNFINEIEVQPNADLSLYVVALNRLKPLIN